MDSTVEAMARAQQLHLAVAPTAPPPTYLEHRGRLAQPVDRGQLKQAAPIPEVLAPPGFTPVLTVRGCLRNSGPPALRTTSKHRQDTPTYANA